MTHDPIVCARAAVALERRIRRATRLAHPVLPVLLAARGTCRCDHERLHARLMSGEGLALVAA